MSFVSCGLTALSVAVLFYSWRGYHHKQEERCRQLRGRVAYMLWVAAAGVRR